VKMSVDLIHQTISDLRSGADVRPEAAPAIFDAMISVTDETLLVELLSTWNDKGIAEDELYQLALIMRSRMKRIVPRHNTFVDAVGTGGSRAKTFNVSTAAAFVVAGADVPVAKHGNRAASSKTGSADLLSELGVKVDVEPGTAENNLNELGICFMFAPKFHALSPSLTAARRRLGEPTIFNCLGPLCNPASAPYQVIGAWERNVSKTLAGVLARLGTRRSWVINSDDGLDEISLAAASTVYDICCGQVKEIRLSPEDLGIERSDQVPTAATRVESADIVRKVFSSVEANSPAERIVAVNAAAAIYISGGTGSLREAFEIASESIRSGRASAKLRSLSEATNR
jgi:anthranilate phosphoribosyltransferase